MRLGAPESILRKAGAAWTDAETEAAFEWVLTCELTRLIRFVRARFGVADPEDVVCSSILAAYRYRHTYDPTRHAYYDAAKPDAGVRAFSNWITKIVTNEALRAKRGQTRAAVLLSMLPPVSPPPRPQWLEVVHLLPELERLRPQYREAIELVVRDGLSYAEAAARSRFPPCTAGAMRVRYHRAVQELKRLRGEDRSGLQGR